MTKHHEPDRADEADAILRKPESTREELAAALGLVEAASASIQAEIAGAPEREAEIQRSEAPMATKVANLEAEADRLQALTRRLALVEILKSQLAERSEQRRASDWQSIVEARRASIEDRKDRLNYRERLGAIAAAIGQLHADCGEVDSAIEGVNQDLPVERRIERFDRDRWPVKRAPKKVTGRATIEFPIPGDEQHITLQRWGSRLVEREEYFEWYVGHPPYHTTTQLLAKSLQPLQEALALPITPVLEQRPRYVFDRPVVGEDAPSEPMAAAAE